jgi:hypothetical protein
VRAQTHGSPRNPEQMVSVCDEGAEERAFRTICHPALG